jgi:hypothetical protein
MGETALRVIAHELVASIKSLNGATRISRFERLQT